MKKLKIPHYMVNGMPVRDLEKEDIHYPNQEYEYVIDDQRIDSDTWERFMAFVKTHPLSERNMKTIDKRNTLQTEYQLDVCGVENVTIFFEQNNNCNSIISPFKWILIKWLEEFPNSDEGQVRNDQCDKNYQDNKINWICQKDKDHEGECRFANKEF